MNNNSFRQLLNFILHTFVFVFYIKLANPINLITKVVETGKLWNYFGIKELAMFALMIIGILFLLGCTVVFIIKAISGLILFFYYEFFYNEESVELKIDENNVIHESYVKLKNGNTIPIYINRIFIGTIPPAPQEERVKENETEQ